MEMRGKVHGPVLWAARLLAGQQVKSQGPCGGLLRLWH